MSATTYTIHNTPVDIYGAILIPEADGVKTVGPVKFKVSDGTKIEDIERAEEMAAAERIGICITCIKYKAAPASNVCEGCVLDGLGDAI